MRNPAKILFAILVMLCAPAARADEYPSRAIRLVVGYGAGGSTDIFARLVAEYLSKTLGQRVFVENKPGAAGMVAATAVAQSPPDGYTILFSASSIATDYAIKQSLSFDFLKELRPVTRVGRAPLVLFANPTLPVQNVQELIAYAKARPSQLFFATVGVGGHVHLAAERFFSEAKIKVSTVPYTGSSQTMTAVVANDVKLG